MVIQCIWRYHNLFDAQGLMNAPRYMAGGNSGYTVSCSQFLRGGVDCR